MPVVRRFTARRPSLAVLAVALAAGCTSTGRTYVSPALTSGAADTAEASPVAYRVLLIGDAGAVRTDGADPVLGTLRAHAEAAGPQSITVFLGDNVYPHGLPPAGDPDRARAEAILDAQIDALRSLPGRALFLPGNHDWKNSKAGGLQQLREQEAYLKARLGSKGTFLPSGGFPGPAHLDLGERLRLVAIDTEWWLGQHERAEGEDADGTEVRDDADFLVALSDEVQRARSRRMLVVGHHPLFSNSNHAGVVSPRKQLSPPVIGTIAAFVRRSVGKSPQDLASSRYSALRLGLQRIFTQRDGLVYAAGHEHTLQYFPVRRQGALQHHLVSGSGSQSSYVTGGRGAAFTSPERGFMVLTYFDDGSARMDAIRPHAGRPFGDTLVSVPLLEADPDLVAPPVVAPSAPPVLPATATGVPSTTYDDAGWLARTFLGEGYRKTWALPVTVPVFDIGRVAGGLTPTRLGGSRQTQSVRLVDAQGREYVLRSLDKTPNNPLNLGLRYGIAHDIAEDLTSAMYPYGALVAARLSASAGLFHTAPQIVYVPSDPRFGPYQEAFAGQLMLFEQRPDGDARDLPNQGRAREVISTAGLFRELDADVDHRLDARFYLRARLFDMLIGDWDRHQDQWRWAAFEPGALDATLHGEDATRGKVYRPIARDRDWALNDRTGCLFRLARPFVPKLTGFQAHYGNLRGLTFNGRQLDERFLAELDRADWQAAAASLQRALPDSVLEAAVATIPAAARARDGREILKRLKLRRDALQSAALGYYRLRAHAVDVIGSQDDEVFRAERQGPDSLRLSVYRRKKNGDAGERLWRRTFVQQDTDEVRIWARGGKDRLEVDGQGARILLRFLGGAGFDEVDDATDGARLFLYDTPADSALTLVRRGPKARVEQSDRIVETSFGYVPPTAGFTRPLAAFDSNIDDGLRIGLGVDVATPGFLRTPYMRRQRLVAGYATASGGFFGDYAGHFPGLLGLWDGGLALRGQTALAYRNFFGYGGGAEVAPGASPAYYRVRMASVHVAPFAARNLMGRLSGRIGPTLDYADPHRDSSRFLAAAPLPARDLAPQWLAGAEAQFTADATDNPLRPARGLRMEAGLRARTGLRDPAHRYAALRSEAALYFTKQRLPWATLGVRVGGEHLVGTFPFYDAATLGGTDNLRGYRVHRFAGRSTLYASAEPRVRLNRFRAVLWPDGEFGLLGFADAGRVWADAADDGPWRLGYGGGLWLALSPTLGGTLTYDVSDETRALSLRFGLAF